MSSRPTQKRALRHLLVVHDEADEGEPEDVLLAGLAKHTASRPQFSAAASTSIGRLSYVIHGRRWTAQARPAETDKQLAYRLADEVATTPGEPYEPGATL